jgi:hypothetical protein
MVTIYTFKMDTHENTIHSWKGVGRDLSGIDAFSLVKMQ